jgi:hypothetical protein
MAPKPTNLWFGNARAIGEAVRPDHGLGEGLVVKTGKAGLSYSCRGCFYLYWQVIKDMVRVLSGGQRYKFYQKAKMSCH